MRSKVTVVGAGNVGASCAQLLAQRDYANVVLVDIIEGMPRVSLSTCGRPGLSATTTPTSWAQTTMQTLLIQT